MALIASVLFVFTVANAEVTIKQGDKVVRYANNVTVTIDSTEDTVVDYNGVDVFVPKGTKVTLTPAANNTVAVIGSGMQNVRVYGLTLNASGRSAMVVNPADKTLAVREGTVQVKSPDGQTATAAAGYVVNVNSMLAGTAAGTAAVSKQTQTKKAEEATAKKQATASNKSNVAGKQAAAEESGLNGVDSSFVNDLINDTFGDNPNNQQAAGDVKEEEEVLSPSAPR